MMLKRRGLFILLFFIQAATSQVIQDERQQLIRPKEEILAGVEHEPGIHSPPTTVTIPAEPTIIPAVHDGSTFLTVQRFQRKRVGRRQGKMARNVDVDGTGRSNDAPTEGVRQRLDSIILLISRMSDRLVAMETVQSQWKERIDNIQYRLTKTEIMDEERKSQLADVGNSVKHRLQSTDHSLEQLQSAMEDIKTSLELLNDKDTQINNSIKSLTLPSSDKPKMQSILASIFGIKNDIQKLSINLENSANTVRNIQNTTRHLSGLGESYVTKSYLTKSMVDYQTTNQDKGRLSLAECAMVKKSSSNKKADAQDCWELIKKRGATTSGVYRIQPIISSQPFYVYCDMETSGGGWTVIQRRHDGSVDFLREWIDYKHGFGNLAGEFWLGNEKIHHLTNYHVSEMEIELSDFDQQTARAHYSAFAMGNEVEGYALKLLGHYEGDAGDSLLYHVGQRWSTIDSDSDAYPEHNCARDQNGAWWYKACGTSNLNGHFLHGPVPLDHEYKGMYWYDFRGPLYSLWKTTIMIRRGGNVKMPITVQPLTPKPEEDMTPTFNPDSDPYVTYEHGYDQMG